MSERRRSPQAQLAYVLHAYDWSESSLILDLYTRQDGRLVAVAKGAKRPYSQLRSVLLPFQRVHVQLNRPRAQQADDEVRTLRSAEWSAGAGVLPAQSLLGAYYANELVMKFLPRGASQTELFDHYHDTLVAMADASLDLQSSLRAFELLLLRELGLLPDLAQEAWGTAALETDELYTWRPEAGLMRARAQEDALAGHQWLGLQAALLSGNKAALRHACQAPKAPLRNLLRAALAYHLGGAVLRTRELVHSLRRLGSPALLGADP